MKIVSAFMLAAFAGTAALADSYSVAIGGGSGSGKTSAISFAGFDATLGQLTSVTFDISAKTTYDVTVYSPPNSLPPSGTATYSFKNGYFLYINGVGTQPYVPETGSGTASLSYGVFSGSTAGVDGMTTITGVSQLAAFLTPSLSGYASVDDPFFRSISVNGAPTSAMMFDVTSKALSGTVTYAYATPRGAVPEPAVWVAMVMGFGLIGAAARGQRRTERYFGDAV